MKIYFLRNAKTNRSSARHTVEGLPGGGGSLFPCSLPKLPYVPMFPHSLRMFSNCNFRNVVSCFQKLANVPLFPSIFCQCSIVPQNPWETLTVCSLKHSQILVKFVTIRLIFRRCLHYKLTRET